MRAVPCKRLPYCRSVLLRVAEDLRGVARIGLIQFALQEHILVILVYINLPEASVHVRL